MAALRIPGVVHCVKNRCLATQAPAGRAPLQPGPASRRRPLLASPAASSSAAMPAPDSGSGNGAVQPGAPREGSSNGAGAVPVAPAAASSGFFGWLQAQQRKSAELRAKLATLGLAAVLAYGESLHRRAPLGSRCLPSLWAPPTRRPCDPRLAPACCAARSAAHAACSDHRKAQRARRRKRRLAIPYAHPAGLFDGVSYTIAFALAFIGYEAQTGLNPTQNVSDIVKICILMCAAASIPGTSLLLGRERPRKAAAPCGCSLHSCAAARRGAASLGPRRVSHNVAALGVPPRDPPLGHALTASCRSRHLPARPQVGRQ